MNASLSSFLLACIPNPHHHLNCIPQWHYTTTVSHRGQGVRLHTLSKELKCMKVELHLKRTWKRHRLCHEGFKMQCFQYLLDVTDPVHISNGKFAINKHPTELVMMHSSIWMYGEIALRHAAPDVLATFQSFSAHLACLRDTGTKIKT